MRTTDNLKKLARAALIRAAWTACEAAVPMIPLGAALEEVRWLHVVSVCACAAVLSFIKSMGTGLPEVDTGV